MAWDGLEAPFEAIGIAGFKTGGVNISITFDANKYLRFTQPLPTFDVYVVVLPEMPVAPKLLLERLFDAHRLVLISGTV
jgi:hypothetical protein